MNDDDLRACVENGLLRIRVTPRASCDRIRIERRDDGSRLLRVEVTAAPDKGKANAAALALLAEALGRPKSALSLAQGATARDKVVRVG